MWGHTWQITLGMALVYLLASSVLRGASIRPALSATLLAWMYFVRPTGAVAVIVVGAYVLFYRRADLMVFAATGIAWLLAWIAYNLRIFGTVLPFYYTTQAWNLGGTPRAICGNIFSPTGGLLIFSPIFAVAIYWVIRYWDRMPARPLATVSLLAISGIMLSVAAHADWWGGACYGPRYMTDALPWLILLAILGISSIPAPRRTLRSPSIAVATFALILSIGINCVGAWSWTAADWNFRAPHPAKLDWRELQFLAPWVDLAPKNSNPALPRITAAPGSD